MSQEKSIDVLNTLIEINNDRVEGYKTASKETEEQDLRELFASLSGTSEEANEKLTHEVLRLGGKPTEGTRTSGKFFRAWMDVKAALTGKDRKAILNSCEYGEDVAVATYEKALKEHVEDLSKEQVNIITHQHLLIKADHDKVKSLRDAWVEA